MRLSLKGRQCLLATFSLPFLSSLVKLPNASLNPIPTFKLKKMVEDSRNNLLPQILYIALQKLKLCTKLHFLD